MTDRSSSATQIARNYLFVFLAQMVRLGANVVVFIGIARLYGPEAFGQFTTAHTFSLLFVLFADFGFDTLLASEVARNRQRAGDLVHTYFTMKLIFAFCASVILVFVAHAKHLSDNTVALIHVFALYVFFTSLTNFFFALFKSFEEMHHEVRISFFMNLVLFLAVIALGLGHVSTLWLAAAFVGSRIVGFVLSVPTALRLVPFRISSMRLAKRDELRGISIFGFSTISGFLFFTQDTIMLAWWAGDREVAVYQAVIKIVGLSLIISDIAFYSLLPVLSRLHSESREKWLRLLRILHKMLVNIGVLIGFSLFVFAEPLIGFLFGLKDFQSSVPILRIFGVVVFVRYLGEASGTSLTTSSRVVRRLAVMVVGVVLNGGLNALVIPRFGAFGASIVSLVTNTFVVFGYIMVSRPESMAWVTEWRNYLGVVIALVCGGIALSVPDGPGALLGLLGAIILACVIYFVVFGSDERELLIGALLRSVRRPEIDGR